MEPEIFINFKHYENAVGNNCEKLLNDFSNLKDNNIYYCLSYIDLRLNSKFNNLKRFSQSVDVNDYGAFTGSVSMESLMSIGIHGSLLNHSENRINEENIIRILEKSKNNNFTIVLCAENIEEIKKYSKFEPDYIAYEPPELIGGNISVSNAKPEIIEEAGKICKNRTKLLVGAGVKTKEDIDRSMDLGAHGVLIASGIIRDPKPINKLISLTHTR